MMSEFFIIIWSSGDLFMFDDNWCNRIDPFIHSHFSTKSTALKTWTNWRHFHMFMYKISSCCHILFSCNLNIFGSWLLRLKAFPCVKCSKQWKRSINIVMRHCQNFWTGLEKWKTSWQPKMLSKKMQMNSITRSTSWRWLFFSLFLISKKVTFWMKHTSKSSVMLMMVVVVMVIILLLIMTKKNRS